MRADSRLGVEEDHRVSGEGRVSRCLNAAATSGAGPTPTCWRQEGANPSLEARASAPSVLTGEGLGAGARSSSQGRTSIHDHRKNHSLDETNLCWQSSC